MRIRDLRLERGFSQRELAAAVGIAPNTLSQYENEKREPDLKTLECIADFLNVSIDCIMGRNRETPVPTDEDGLSETAKRFMGLVDGLTQDQQQLLLAQLQAWTEQNQRLDVAARQSGAEKVSRSES